MTAFSPSLVQAARRHEPEAWSILLKEHQLPLYAYAAELLGDETGALDVVQETFAAAVRHIGSLREDARFGSWLFGIAHQKCVQRWRRSRRAEEVFAPSAEDAPDAGEYPDDGTPDPRATLLRREESEEFFATVATLSPAHRSVLLLHVLEEFSLEDIARITEVPVGTVKSRLHHAKRALREALEARP